MLRMSMQMRVAQRLEQSLQLSMSQKLDLRLALLDALRGIQLTPRAVCTHCGHRLSNDEVLRGFTQDPKDTSTGCPKCEGRFQPKLKHTSLGGSVEVNFLCAIQTLDALRDKQELSPDELRRLHAPAYHSALTHFGSLTGAFKELGVKYRKEIYKSWREKVRPFLGEYPDGLLAECVGISRASIQGYRKKLGISHYVPAG